MSIEEPREIAFEKAKANGLRIVPTEPTLLLLDIDTDEDFEHCRKMLKVVNRKHRIASAEYSRSKSNHFHVFVRMVSPLSVEQRLFLQAVCGSDRMKEMLSYRDMTGPEDTDAIVLFATEQPRTRMTL